MFDVLRPAAILLGLSTLVTGVLYPLAVTGVAQLAFPGEANGSLVTRRGQVVGSACVGQAFQAPGYFWGRPSATPLEPYDARASTGSNLGPSNPALAAAVSERVAAVRAANPQHAERRVPVDLVTTSASGLDPHITPASALLQVARVARARGIPEDSVRALVEANVEGRTLGLLGEPRVNVLRLNLALDALSKDGP